MRNRLLIGLLFFSLFGWGQVPDTNTFTLDTVVKVVNPATNDLSACFSAAVKANFDPLYDSIGYAPVNSLLRFRNYQVSEAPSDFDSIKYGYLYNWYAATDARNIAASGWHLPIGIYYDINDTYTLANFLEPGCNWSTNTVGNLIKESGTEFWEVDSGSTNSTGFNARGAGVRSEVTGAFTSKNVYMEFWTESQYWNSGSTAPVCILSSMHSWFSVQKSGTNVEDKKRGISIRLIKDSTTLSHGQSGTYTGNDGKVYRTICIGTQEWLADNLAETKYRNGDTIPTVTDNTTWAGLTTGAKCAYNNDESNVME
jgi:uncharacterized protein (TIGR02145 family)